jgi:hypothetical protein
LAGKRLAKIGWQRSVGKDRLAKIGWQRPVGKDRLAKIGWQRSISANRFLPTDFLLTSSPLLHNGSMTFLRGAAA